MNFQKLVGTLLLFLLVLACKDKTDFQHIPAKSKTGNFHAVIEIPAGTNQKIEYDKKEKEFLIDKRDGEERTINFLPYPVNYGFIPSTFSDPSRGGDGDPLDVLVLSESRATGKVLDVLPVAMLKLIDNGELDNKILAVPVVKNERIINVENYNDLAERYPEALQILELWFLAYDPQDSLKFEGWGNKEEAITEIEKWLIN